MPTAYSIATYKSIAPYHTGGLGVMQAGGQRQPAKFHWQSATARYYAPSSEREITCGKATNYTYIEGPHGPVAAVQTTGAQHDVMLIATDHLGSIIGVWNASGTLLEEHRYSAWGLRTSSTANPRLRRGFTGHEHLQQFGLIDMQARLYDPHLGRFLVPDPYVQAPDNHLSLNRYAYCMNNPLKYVDPTGEKWWHWALGISTILDPISTITALTFTAAATFTASATDKEATTGLTNIISGLIGSGHQEMVHRVVNATCTLGRIAQRAQGIELKDGEMYGIVLRCTFSSIPQAAIPYGILYNRVSGWSGLVDWKSGDTTSFSHIKQSWYDLERAMNMPTGSYEGLADRIAIAKDQGILPLVTINCGMSYIEPNAFVDGRLRLASGLVQLSDMALRRGATAAARKPYTLM